MNKTINGYQIEQELSTQAERKTFLARDTNSDDLVVIKILQFNSSFFSWDELKLFEREAQTLQNLNHPAIPQYLDYFEVNNEEISGFALVQTYIDSPSLETTIKQGRKFSEVELMELAEKLLDILTYLHQQHPPVIHRDIKPSNILINNRSGNSIGDIYLVDFGSAKTVASRENGTITIVGTYGYIPLEQFGGQAVPASDLYSLGMTLIYLITGKHPADLPQVNGEIQFNSSSISNQFTRWLDKMINPYLERRFDSAKLAKTALKSPDGSYGNMLHLRPKNSKVKLVCDRHKLVIVYQDGVVTQNSPIGIGCLFFIIIFFIGLLVFGGIMIILAFPLSLLINNIIKLLFPEKNFNFYKILSIDLNDRILQGSYKEGKEIEWERFSHAHSINFLKYSAGYTFNKVYDKKKVGYGTLRLNPKLFIYAGKNKYTGNGDEFIIESDDLSSEELLWLGNELADFLDLELQIIDLQQPN